MQKKKVSKRSSSTFALAATWVTVIENVEGTIKEGGRREAAGTGFQGNVK